MNLTDLRISAPSARKIVLVFFLFYTIAYSTLSVLRHRRFNSASFDLAIVDQTIWNTSRGRLFETTLEYGIDNKNYLATHFSPILVLLAPLYWIWDNVIMILLAQSALLGAGVFAVYRIACKELEDHHWGLLFCLLYLFYPPIGFINRFDFHQVALVIPLILFAWVFYNERSLKAASVCLGLALCCKESVGITLFAAGLVMAQKDRSRFWLVWSLISLAVSLTGYFYIIPLFKGSLPLSAKRYGWLGGSPLEMIGRLITHPWESISHQLGIGQEGFIELFGRLRRVYPLKMLLPLLFLPLLGWPISLAVVPAFGYNLLSSAVTQTSIYYQYNSPIIPYLFISAILGFKRILRWSRGGSREWVPKLTGCVLLVICTISFIHDNPFTRVVDRPFYPVFAAAAFPGAEEFYEAAEMIAPDASVHAGCSFAPHLSHRREIYHLYGSELFADYIFFHKGDFRWHLNPRYARYILKLPGYRTIYSKNDVVLLKAKRTENMRMK